MLPPAGMGDMPSFCPGEGRVVPPTGFRPVDISHAEKRMAGLNLFGGGRANGLFPASLDDRANDRSEHIADAPPRAVGLVEVVTAADEVSDLHDPKVRHGAVACLKTRWGNELTPQIGVLARVTA